MSYEGTYPALDPSDSLHPAAFDPSIPLVERTRLARQAVRIGVVSYTLVTGALLLACLRVNAGRFVYTLDDPYIHLAMVRNLLEAGSYGVEPGVYSSASSSPGWVVLLAMLGKVLGTETLELLPLALNLLFGTMVVVSFIRTLARSWPDATTRWQARWVRGAAAALPVLLYLPGLTLMGMEHTLHLLLTLLFAVRLVEPDASKRHTARLVALALGLALVRPEGVVEAAIGGVVLATKRRGRAGVLVAGAALLPVAVVGVINRVHGDLWLPNSVLAKTGIFPKSGQVHHEHLFKLLSHYVEEWGGRLGHDPALLALVAAIAWILAFQVGRGVRRDPTLQGFFLACVLGHAVVASMGWYERYQAYLIGLGLLALAALLGPDLLGPRTPSRRGIAGAWTVVLATPLLFSRELHATSLAWVASNNIYEQQYQMARFVAAEFGAAPVALNDIGAVSYLHPGPVLDLVGLGSVTVLRLRRAGHYDAAAIARLARARGVQVAILYDGWFPRDDGSGEGDGARPYGWQRVATWEISRLDVTPAEKSVSFYALGGTESILRLKRALQHFAPRLPPHVKVRYG
jgi:hypothetical protein